MDKKFLAENFDKLAHNNRLLLIGEIRGILLYFRGCGYTPTPAMDTCVDCNYTNEDRVKEQYWVVGAS